MLGLSGFFRVRKLRFVKREQVIGDIYAFYFQPTRPLKHAAGQHSVFFLPAFKGVRVFSLGSSPNEKYVMIATHVRPGSNYKQRLMHLKKGELLWTIGPALNFVFKPNKKRVIFLAQGIGITPFRSMLVEAKESGRDVASTLIHVDKAEHPFRAVTTPLASFAHFPTTTAQFQTLVEKETQTPGGQYYISGSMKFLRSTVSFLRAHGVKLSQITFDDFLGY